MTAYSVSTGNTGETGNLYPRSRLSQTESIIRSRTWNADITKDWNESVPALDTVADRVNRYILYFSLIPDQLRVLIDRFHGELVASVEAHRESVTAAMRGTQQSNDSASSLLCLDTYVPERSLPKGSEKDKSAIALNLSGPELFTVKVCLRGNKELSLSNHQSTSLREHSSHPLGLMDKSATASQLFDTMSHAATQASDKSTPVNVGLAIGFPCEQRGQDSATLLKWTKGFQTGRSTNDAIEGMDIAALLDCAFYRQGSKAKATAAVNDAVATLVAGCYELPSNLPAPKMSMVICGGVNAAYLQPDAESFGYVGSLLNCEIGAFDKSLPLNDVDLEVDFADEAGRGQQLFEKMCGTTYLGEICRRLIVKVWQNEAPPLAWVRYSMPWTACVRVILDNSSELEIIRQILSRLWEWEATLDERRTVQRLFEAVFHRAAALCSVALIAVAQRTEKLQAAMGGLTCAISGKLATRMPKFIERIKENLRVILGDETAKLLCLQIVEDGPLKGAGILAATCDN